MALLIGTKPIAWDSVLLGLTLRIYNQLLTEGFFPPETPIVTVVDGVTYTEPTNQRNDRVLKAKLFAYSVAKSTIDEIVANASVTSNVSVTSVSGVVTGPSVSGPGTGTATGTIS